MSFSRVCFLTIFIPLFVSTGCIAQNYSSDVNWLIDVLELKEGSVVADIGAGDGDQTLAIARHIRSKGQIYSTELGTESVRELREEIKQSSLDNITVLEGHPNRTNLPAECCDAIYLRRVYHHFGNPDSMNTSLLESLKPGGRLAVIDFEPRGSEAEPGERTSGSQHGVTNKTVVTELERAGFELISNNQNGRNIYIVMRKPAN
ncbi:MAG: methyltransferase domain-containing protein [Balneolaceae bacterium]|nr:methyltransferase domain-containing protein [Balneolaceae bacterium]